MIQAILIISEQACLHFPLVLGSYLSFSLMKVPDLSIESSYAFGAIATSLILPFCTASSQVFNLLIVVCASLLGGLFVGLLSGLFTQKAGLPHLLSSIITIGLFHGINQYVLGQPILSLNGIAHTLESDVFGKQNPELFILSLIVGLILIAGYFFLKTQLGYMFAVYGENPRFFCHYNISTMFVFLFGIGLANALAGLSGYFDAQSSGFIDVSMGTGKALFCITALILGKVITQSKRPVSILVPLLGSFGYFSLQQVLLNIGLNLKYFTAVQAFIVLIALVVHHKSEKDGGEKIDNLGV